MKNEKSSEIKRKRLIAVSTIGALLIVVAAVMLINVNSAEQVPNKDLVDLNDTPVKVAEATPVPKANENQGFAAKEPNKSNGVELTKGEPDKDNKGIVDEVVDGGKSNVDQSELKQDTENKSASAAPNKEAAEEDSAAEVSSGKSSVDKKDKKQDEKSAETMNTALESLNFKPENGLAWPILGNILLGYSDDHGIYHATLMQFRTNPAILIGGEVGQEVIAAATGIVTEIVNSHQTGTTITMDIGNDYKLVYGQLAETELAVGDTIEEGEAIGKIAEVSNFYSVEGTNLYFKVMQGEDPVNPTTLLRNIEEEE